MIINIWEPDMTTLEIVLLTIIGFLVAIVVVLGAACWHQEKLIIAQFKWFQEQLGHGPEEKKQ